MTKRPSFLENSRLEIFSELEIFREIGRSRLIKWCWMPKKAKKYLFWVPYFSWIFQYSLLTPVPTVSFLAHGTRFFFMLLNHVISFALFYKKTKALSKYKEKHICTSCHFCSFKTCIINVYINYKLLYHLLLTLVAVVSQILLSRHFEVNKWSV